MKGRLLTSNPETRLQFKEPAGWFVAGEGFRRALNMLSDGAFRLFAYLSLQALQADRRTGRLALTPKDLASASGKSKRIIGIYVAEREAKEVYKVHSGKNKFTATAYEISDPY